MDDFDRAWERERYRRRREEPGYLDRKREAARARRARLGQAERPRPTSEEARAKRNAAGRAKTAAKRAAWDRLPFVGVDGEGITVGDPFVVKTPAGTEFTRLGDHRYALLRAGTEELYRGGRALTTAECLRFLTGLPYDDRNAILVSFFFGYDVNCMLRGPFPPEPSSRYRDRRGRWRVRETRLHRILNHPFSWTWISYDGHPTYGVDYLPRKHLKVCLLHVDHRGRPVLNKNGRKQAAPGSKRTIFDLAGNWHDRFVNVLARYPQSATEAERVMVAAMKDERGSFAEITDKVRDYNRIECEALARVAEEFRRDTLAGELRPLTWDGAGALAGAMFKKHGEITRREMEETTPRPVIDLAWRGFYGGRFEASRVGWVGGPGDGGGVNQDDLTSAYPAAMTRLPCFRHGRWLRVTAGELAELGGEEAFPYIAEVRYSHPEAQLWCGLPHRTRAGTLRWQQHGNGVYWGIEIASAIRLGARIEHGDGWRWEPAGCDCPRHAWIRDYFELRRRLGNAGEPFKTGINAAYGKRAQRKGERGDRKPGWQHPVIAGLITATTRAALNDAIRAAGQSRVVMIATDAVFTIGRPLRLPRGKIIPSAEPGPFKRMKELGKWEATRYPDGLFIVRPGIYWPPPPEGAALSEFKAKSRGLSPKFFLRHVASIMAAWEAFAARGEGRGGEGELLNQTPVLSIPTTLFVAHKLALLLGAPELAGQWIEKPITLRFGDRGGVGEMKRGRVTWSASGRGLVMAAQHGSPHDRSMTYTHEAPPPRDYDFEREREELADQPDFLDLGGNPYDMEF